ncbi:MAG: hypothetical protein IPP66_15055 [Anaerolineales bacterium]|nr:hypothetical protein [Anaerolineales bacterium]
MIIKNKFQKLITITLIFNMLFSAIQPVTVSAQSGDGIRRQFNAQSSRVSFIGPESGRVLSASRILGAFARPQDPGRALVNKFAPEFGVTNPARDLSEMKSVRAEDGRLTVRYQQEYNGIPVMGGELIVNTNDKGDLYSMNGEVSPNLSLLTDPVIDASQATETALGAMAKWYQASPEEFVVSEPELWVFDESLLQPSTRPVELVWRMEITPIDEGMPVRELVLVNAQRGNISLHFNQVDTSWKLTGSSGKSQDLDPTPTPLPPETTFPTETSIPSEDPVLTETPIPSETSIPTETLTATVAVLPTEEISTRETPINEVTATGGAPWYVATTGDDLNSCSTSALPCATIQAAINKAAADDIIVVAAGTYTPVTISKSLTLSGGWDVTFTSQSRHSFIQGSDTVDGISTSGTVVSITRFVVQKSKFGIYHNGGTLSFEQGGLINNKNGIYNYNGDTTFVNTTISGHQSTSPAGSAISNVHGLIQIQSSTITGNGGSQAIRSTNSNAHIEIENSILAGNAEVDCYVSSGNMTSTGYNIFGRSPACFGVFVPHPTDRLGVDPQLSTLLPLGYHPIASTSPAVDHADPASCPATDQRSITRPQGAACDIGAFEYMAPGLAAFLGIVSGSDQHSGPSLPFQFPLAVYVTDAFGNPISGATVTFTAPVSGPGGTFEDTQNSITVATTNDNGIATSSMFTANSQIGSYNVVATTPGLPGSVSFALTNAVWFVSPTGNDANSCSVPAAPCLTINKAVTKAVNGDAIQIAVGTYAPASISKSLTLQGGWDSAFTSQNGYSIVQGSATADGITTSGTYVSISRFVVQNSKFGIYHNGGTLSFEQGGLINNKNGIYNSSGDTSFTNTTISGNQSSSISGSAIIANGIGAVRIQYSTITNNTGSYAIYNTSSNAPIEIGNSILAGNASGDCYIGSNIMTSTGHNIFGRFPVCSSSSSVVPDSTDQVGVDPQLSPLLPLGYHPIASTSPAVGHADPASCPATDQRGITRPQGAACDIGAFEYMAPGLAAFLGIVSGSDQHSGPSLPFQFPLAVYVTDAFGNPISGATVTFTAPASGPGGTFDDTQNNITVATTNDNGIATPSMFTANSQIGSYNVVATTPGLPGSVSFALTNAVWFVSPTGNDANSCSVLLLHVLQLTKQSRKRSMGMPFKLQWEPMHRQVFTKA